MRFDAGQTFLEIDLLKKSDSRKSGFKLSGIATQGDSKLQAWVSQFQEGPKILNIQNRRKSKNNNNTYVLLKRSATL